MKRIILSLLLMGFLIGCVTAEPKFPLPSPRVAYMLEALSSQDTEFYLWNVQLFEFCQKVGTCSLNEPVEVTKDAL